VPKENPMSDLSDPELLEPGDARASGSELEDRRLLALRLRARRLTEQQIADTLGVSRPTISRDLAYVRTHGEEMFGTRPAFDAAVFIGESLSTYQDLEASALRDSSKNALSIRERHTALRTALMARQAMVNFVSDLGLLRRAQSVAAAGLPSFEEIRRAMAAASAEMEDPKVPTM
jgi:predicted transcriptional regulator